MKARLKWESEWKEYREAFGKDGVLCGLVVRTVEKTASGIAGERGVEPDEFAARKVTGEARDEIYPLGCFEIWNCREKSEPGTDAAVYSAAALAALMTLGERENLYEYTGGGHSRKTGVRWNPMFSDSEMVSRASSIGDMMAVKAGIAEPGVSTVIHRIRAWVERHGTFAESGWDKAVYVSDLMKMLENVAKPDYDEQEQ